MPIITPDTWSVAVTADNIWDFPVEHDIIDSRGTGWRPGAFVPPIHERGMDPRLAAIDETGQVRALHITDVAHMATYLDRELDWRFGYTALLRHRKGGAVDREPQWRILSLLDPEAGFTAEIRHGEHPEHPGEAGYYFGARHIGNVTLDLADVTYLPEAEIAVKYFPFPVREA